MRENRIRRGIRITPRMTAALLATLLLCSGQLNAHEGATGVVRDRMELMERFGKNMKAIKPLVRSRSAYDAERVAQLAGEIEEMSYHIEAKFPADSNQRPSEALPAIWEDWDRFAGLIDEMREASARLGETALDGDQRSALKQFIVLGRTCKGCHTDFRQKKQ